MRARGLELYLTRFGFVLVSTGSVAEALRNLDLPTASSLASHSLDPRTAESLRSQRSRTEQVLDDVLAQIQETSSKLDRILPPLPGRDDASLVDQLLSALLPSIESTKLDVNSLSQSVVVALAPIVEAQGSLAEERSINPEKVLELLLPPLETLKTTPLDQEALVLALSGAVSDALSRSVVPRLEEKMVSFLEASKPPPPLDTKALVEEFVGALPPPPSNPPPPPPATPIDLSGVHTKLESILVQIAQAAELNSQGEAAHLSKPSSSSSTSTLEAEITELTSALRESKAVADLQSERAKVAEEERKRIGLELEVSRKTALDRLKEKAEEELTKVRGEHEVVELRAKLKSAEEERDASLGREKMFRKENEDRARVSLQAASSSSSSFVPASL